MLSGAARRENIGGAETLNKTTGWRQIALIVWIVAVIAVHWLVQPGPGYRQLAERVKIVGSVGDAVKALFYRDYIF